MNKKTIVQINAVTRGSPGSIMFGISDCARKRGYNVITFSQNGRSQRKDVNNHYLVGTILEKKLSQHVCYNTGNLDSLNWIGTYELIHKLKKINPDIIHLHNLHGGYLNLQMLFNYLKSVHIPVIWTLHDCWAFTAQCAYFDIEDCKKWIYGCDKCSQFHLYPSTKSDHTKKLYAKKKEMFSGLNNMTIVTCSEWLGELVKQSYLKNYDLRVINNGIDLTIFKPHCSQVREIYHLENKFIVLCVAFSWGYRKGLDRIERLAEVLDDRFQIMMVGIDKCNVKSENIICIPRTDSQSELSDIYASSDVFLNTTREDNFPTVNIEALACGIPVLSYGAGGSAEAFDENSGMIVTDNTVIDILNKLYENNFSREKCAERGKFYDMNIKFQEYVDLYNEKANM
ncbi:MAG: glycosyltransferase [Lachnospiraceae bacterium]|nr:glycosyltransferase [Lachnospiraceae bacterium]